MTFFFKNLFLIPSETITEVSQQTVKFANESVKIVDDISNKINNLESQIILLKKNNSILYNLLIISGISLTIFLYFFLEFYKKNSQFYSEINNIIETSSVQTDENFNKIFFNFNLKKQEIENIFNKSINDLNISFTELKKNFEEISENIIKNSIENLNHDKFEDFNQDLILPLQKSIENVLGKVDSIKDLIDQIPNLNPVVMIVSSFLFKLAEKFHTIYELSINDMAYFNKYISVFKEHSEDLIKNFDNFNSLVHYNTAEILTYAVSFFEKNQYFSEIDKSYFFNSNQTLDYSEQIKLLNYFEEFVKNPNSSKYFINFIKSKPNFNQNHEIINFLQNISLNKSLSTLSD